MSKNLLATRNWVSGIIDSKLLLNKELYYLDYDNEMETSCSLQPNKVTELSISSNEYTRGNGYIAFQNGEPLFKIDFKDEIIYDNFMNVKVLVSTDSFTGEDIIDSMSGEFISNTYKVTDSVIYYLDKNNNWEPYDHSYQYDYGEMINWLSSNSMSDSTVIFTLYVKYKVSINFSDSKLLDESLRNKCFNDTIEFTINIQTDTPNQLYSIMNSHKDIYLYSEHIEDMYLRLKFDLWDLFNSDHKIKGIQSSYKYEGTSIVSTNFDLNIEIPYPESSEVNVCYLLIADPFNGIIINDQNDRRIIGDYCEYGNFNPCLIEFTVTQTSIYARTYCF